MYHDGLRRSPYGERGLKFLRLVPEFPALSGRSPYGERGLKFGPRGLRRTRQLSLSVWGAWIEIKINNHLDGERGVALRMGSVD